MNHLLLKLASLIWIHPEPTLKLWFYKLWFYEGERDSDKASARASEVRRVREVREKDRERERERERFKIASSDLPIFVAAHRS